MTSNFNKNHFCEVKMGPGLYLIWNTAMNKFYIGQSNSVPTRLGSHWKELQIKRHECKPMQQDWNSLGSQHFQFISLDVHEKWANEEKRKQAELELIRLNKSVVYNILTPVKAKKNQYKKPVRFKDTTYASIAEAARMQNIGETQVRRLLRDIKNSDWSQVLTDDCLEKNFINIEKAKKVRVHDQVYRSIRQASIQTGINRRTLSRDLDSSKKDYCSYVEENPL